MSGIEITVVLFGLFLGYWLVSKFITDRPKNSPSSEPKQPAQETEKKTSTQNEPSPEAWHKTLNVSQQATVEEIRRAYKVLMSQYHPDKVASLGDELKALAERKSKEITSAYRNAMQLRGVDT